MIQIILDRIGEFNGNTYGVLKLGVGEGVRPRFVTCEDLWRGNERQVSCIPLGSYLCGEHYSERFGPTFIVNNVPGRSGILFHPGNTHADTEGCILVGSSFNSEPGASGIINSRAAFGKFITLLRGIDEFTLVIRDLTRGPSCSESLPVS